MISKEEKALFSSYIDALLEHSNESLIQLREEIGSKYNLTAAAAQEILTNLIDYPVERAEALWIENIRGEAECAATAAYHLLSKLARGKICYDELRETAIMTKYQQPGIYAIYIEDKLAYLGRSRDMYVRINNHIEEIWENNKSNKYRVLHQAREKGYKIRFDVMAYCEQNDDVLGEAEARLINQYMPPLNYQIPTIGDYKHYTVNRRAKFITLAEILDPTAEVFIF